MNIKQLECFIEITKTLNFTRAAQNLYITQPAVTHQIQTLEDELGLKLFIRSKHNVKLTPAGQSFCNDVQDILTRLNMAVAKAKNYSKEFEASLSIGYEGSVEVKYLSDILKTYKEKMPNVHLYIKMADAVEKSNLFACNKLDIAFAVKESIENVKDTSYIELYKAKFVCVMPKSHALSNQTKLSIADLKGQSLILLDPIKCPSEMARVQRNIQDTCPEAVVYYSDSALNSYTMIKGRLGIAVMPNFVCPEDSDLVFIPIETKEIISYGIAWYNNIKRKEIKEFVSITKDLYRETVGDVS